MKIASAGTCCALLTGCLILTSLGCGSGNTSSQPRTAIASTQNPLVATYRIQFGPRPVTTWVEFGLDTSYGKQTSVANINEYLVPLDVLVAGMLPNTTYHMRAHVTSAGGSWVDEDHVFTTGPLPPAYQLSFAVSRPGPSVQQSGVELIDMVQANAPDPDAVVTDLDGNIIWYYDVGALQGNIPFPIRQLPNGHFLLNVQSAKTADLREIDLAGNTIRDVSLAQINQSLQANGYSIVLATLHHDVIALPNGHWIAIGNTTKEFSNLIGYQGQTSILGDVLVDLDESGNVAWVWSTFDHLDVNRHLQGLPDWTHSNALVYTSDGNLLLSMRNQSWVIKINYADGTGAGDILWKLGEGGDFALAGNNPKEWFYAQHFPNIVNDQGSLFAVAIFDDGNQRILDGIGTECGLPGDPDCYSRAAIYNLDENSKTAEVGWEYLPDLFTFWGGSIGQLDNGDVEFDMSSPVPVPNALSSVFEITPDGQVAWRLDIKQGGNAYRAYRIPSLYPGISWQ